MMARSHGIDFRLNGRDVKAHSAPMARLSNVLRDEFGLYGTKVGCDAGDCGACTVLVEDAARCACLVALGQVAGCTVRTVEGLAQDGILNPLQKAFLRHGAAQCGICTPGMLMAATALLARHPHPTAAQIEIALGGVLCRCTGYRKIIAAVSDAGARVGVEPPADVAVGARVTRLDGPAKVNGSDVFGADNVPRDALWLRVVRSPHAAARVTLGDMRGIVTTTPGLSQILTANHIPINRFGIYPELRDQPVLADGLVRYLGEAVLALVGTQDAIADLPDQSLPISYVPIDAVSNLDAALAPGAPLVHEDCTGNILISGRVKSGDMVDNADALVAEGTFETSRVEHAYIEPEAGWAVRQGDRVEIHVSTQTPYMDRDEVAHILNMSPQNVRIIPTACGGGFGGKLDLSVHALIARAALDSDRPVACVYDRAESMAATTKRHPARIAARFSCDREGVLVSATVDATFDTGAYASWGPTVAGRVPIHASGPYRVPNVSHRGRAVYTNMPPSGAFRGFGVPQAAIAHEAMMDDLALALGIDRFAFRRRNALRAGDRSATGQTLPTSVGLQACLDALAPAWRDACRDARRYNDTAMRWRRGVGIGCMWYGIGNTAMANPSTIRLGVTRDGAIRLANGAVDIGQGSTTVLAQIAADAIGVPLDAIRQVVGDTDHTADAGKTSASRQTFVSGRAAAEAGAALRRQILRCVNAGDGATIHAGDGALTISDGRQSHRLDLAALDADADGLVMYADGVFDPPTTLMDADGQGDPYATYAFGAQIAMVDVDLALGLTKVRHMWAAHDVGRAINPTLVEGQIEGGIAQGLGMALMESYEPGRTANLHDYLVPTFGDVPSIDIYLIEDPEPAGPFGAKGVGEPGLAPTAPAILGAIRHATGVRMTCVPVLPHRLRAAILGRER